MPRAPKLEDVLAALKAAAADPTAPSSLDTVRTALAKGSGPAAARAAAFAGRFELSGLKAELEAAFDRFFARTDADPLCQAKAAIADALYRLDHDDPRVFLRGIRHEQWEPSYGGKVDTAVDLRGSSALGLVRMGYRDALYELARLLADAQAPARISAARAIAYRDGVDGAPLLVLKVRIGDPDPRVVPECLGALLRLAPAQGMPLVREHLEHPSPEVAEGTALVLGESRVEGAFELLRAWCEQRAGQPGEAAGLMALSLLRRDDAWDHLRALVGEASEPTATRAREALAALKQDAAPHKA
jgi:hypothetical protein